MTRLRSALRGLMPVVLIVLMTTLCGLAGSMAVSFADGGESGGQTPPPTLLCVPGTGLLLASYVITTISMM